MAGRAGSGEGSGRESGRDGLPEAAGADGRRGEVAAGRNPRRRTSERTCGPGKTDRHAAADPTRCALCTVRLWRPRNHSQKGAVLTVHSDRPRRLRDPNKRHRVKTRFGREGERRGERLELHSAREQSLQRAAEDVVSATPTLTQSLRSASRNTRDSEDKDSLVM